MLSWSCVDSIQCTLAFSHYNGCLHRASPENFSSRRCETAWSFYTALHAPLSPAPTNVRGISLCRFPPWNLMSRAPPCLPFGSLVSCVFHTEQCLQSRLLSLLLEGKGSGNHQAGLDLDSSWDPRRPRCTLFWSQPAASTSEAMTIGLGLGLGDRVSLARMRPELDTERRARQRLQWSDSNSFLFPLTLRTSQQNRRREKIECIIGAT